MEDITTFIRQVAPNASSKQYTTDRDLIQNILIEAIESPNFSSAQFVKIKDLLERSEPHAWINSVEQIFKNLNPSIHELLLLNLLQTCTRELQGGQSTTAYLCYRNRKYILRFITELTPLYPQIKFALQLAKFIELWIENYPNSDKFELSDYLIRILRYLSQQNYSEQDQRLYLISRRFSGPLQLACKDFDCFKTIIGGILCEILPFSYSNIQAKKQNTQKYQTMFYQVLQEVMKFPEEGEAEEVGIRNRFQYLSQQFNLLVQSPPFCNWLQIKEDSTLQEVVQQLMVGQGEGITYSDVLPGLSNRNIDVRFIRKFVLGDSYTLKVLEILCGGGEAVILNHIAIILCSFANLIGYFNSGQRQDENVKTLIRIFNAMDWIPEIAYELSLKIQLLDCSQVREYLMILWNFLREKFLGNNKRFQKPFIRGFRLIVHRNIANLAELYHKLTKQCTK